MTPEEFAKQFIEAIKGKEAQPKRDHKICLFVSPTIDESCTKTVILFDPLNSKIEKL